MTLSKLSTLCQTEVTNMILTTYDKDLYEKTLKEDAREEGMEYLNFLSSGMGFFFLIL